MKCAVIWFGIYIALDLTAECVIAFFLSMNQYFEEPIPIYYYVYIILLLPLFIAFTLFMLYFCQKDSTYERGKLPLAVFLAFITSLTVLIWTITYICFIYPREDVFVGFGDKAEENEEETNYNKISRAEYLTAFCAWPFISTIFYLFSWLDTKDFIARNHGYQNSR